MIYTDGTHLVADTREELHAFAASVDVKRCWFHRDHYDLTTTARRSAAINGGARIVTPRQVVEVLQRTSQRRRKKR
jgi:hypothetical protein